MLRIKIWLLLPALTLVIPFVGFLLFTNLLAHQAADALERELDHARDWNGAALKMSVAAEERRAADLAAALAASEELAALDAEQPKKPGKKGAQTPSDPGPALAAWLEKNVAAQKTAYTAVFGPDGAEAARFPMEDRDTAACATAATLKGALAGTTGAELIRAGETLTIISAAPVRAAGGIAFALCTARPFDDEIAAAMKQLLGYDVTIFDGPRVATSTLRQSNPEIVASLGKKTGGIVPFGRGTGKGALHFVNVPAFVSLASPVAVPGGEVIVTVTTPFGPAVKDFRLYQHLYLAIMLLTHLLAVVIAWSINNTIKRSTAIITSSLGAAARGNLQVNIPVGALEQPFSTIAESINRTIYAIRERTPLFQPGAKKRELADLIGGAAAPVTGDVRAARPSPADPAPAPPAVKKNPSSDELPMAYSGVRAAAAPPADSAKSAPLSAEIPISDEPAGGEGWADSSEERAEYNPEATVVAMVPTEMIDQVDRELAAMRQAKEAARGGDPLTAVYTEFLQARMRCGEKVENLSEERFVEKLKGNREKLIAQTGCRDVRFNVVVKDGKASIKASPIK